ncbi:MAG: site-specific integrase, partial [Planctomycetes bacterium]|nr:site-specific integrase [Planctomycetota bacterium]
MNTGSIRGPKLCRHKRSGNAYAKFNGRQVWFGPYDHPDTHAEFASYKARWLESGRQIPDAAAESTVLSVGELIDRHLAQLKRRHDARWLANNLTRRECAFEPLRTLFGNLPAGEFGPKRLRAVRQEMIARTRKPEGESEADTRPRLCRKEINERVRTIKTAFRWAASEELIPASVSYALDAVEGLRTGEYGTREGREVHPVSEEVFRATLPFMGRQTRAICEVMWWTGARPSEILHLRPCDIDRTGKVWSAKLAHHKTAKHGKRREIFFGPEAQAVLKPFLLRPPEKPLFSPAEAMEEQNRQRSEARQTPPYPSHMARNEAKRKGREFRETYNS